MSETTHEPTTSSLDLADGTTIPKDKITSLANAINFDDPMLFVSYGSKPLNEVARFADTLLGRVRVKDSGPVGETLQELMIKVRSVDVSEMASPKKSGLAALPLIGSLFSSVQRNLDRFDTVLGQIEAISTRLEDAMLGLLKDIQVLEQLYNCNKGFYEELTATILAGEQRLQTARNEELPALQKAAAQSGSPLDAQRVHDFAEKLNRFERRLHDLKLSRTITLQTAPQIRLVQNNDQTLAEKIQTSILTTIPIWKNQMVIALSLYGQQKAATLQKDVADTTNELLRKNAAMLKTSTTAAAREVERSIVDLDTLRDVQANLVATIEETLAIADEGRRRRGEVEKELCHMEDDLKVKLTALADRQRRQSLEG